MYLVYVYQVNTALTTIHSFYRNSLRSWLIITNNDKYSYSCALVVSATLVAYHDSFSTGSYFYAMQKMIFWCQNDF